MRLVTLRNSTAPVIAVNDVVIANAAIAREVQNHAGANARQGWEEATRALVVRELLTQRARLLGLVAEPQSLDGLRETEEEALIRALLEAEVRTPRADEETCRRYYLANPARFRSPDLFEPVHILFQAARDDEAAFSVALERARAVLAEVTAEPGRFEAMARALSDCPSAAEGGRLGQVARGDTTPEFEAAMLSLRAGETCAEPVLTRYGVHVLRLERKVEGGLLPFEAVRERIARFLEESSWRRAVAQYVALLAGQARIEGFDMPGAATPLVQ
ncbi:peptidylprolyl isomerase [Muricoccus pecuniae]|uniref:Parvulin-like PPIase n=1 Tax=Muricoccus pecuniae TaxID=693023 RepID=A0A840YLM1_9PROT|nr:peptidylprolyl isomerase [Roseomonas pecuniae]MBB5695284.1 peptidyl-prolyl cis-trans isomerase C [Roseomonas pecuniae]